MGTRQGSPVTKEQRQKWKQRQIEQGLCHSCNTPAVDGYWCKEHLARSRNRVKALVARRLKQGLCSRCETPLGFISIRYCNDHAIEASEYQARYRATKGRKLTLALQ